MGPGSAFHRVLYDNEKLSAGELHKAEWDGANSVGTEVSSGTYFYRLVSGNNVSVKKMILLR